MTIMMQAFVLYCNLAGGTTGARHWAGGSSNTRSTAGGGSAIASVPPSVLEARVRGIDHKSPQVLFDIGGLNLWGLRVEEVLGIARDLLMCFHPGVMARLGLSREATEASGKMWCPPGGRSPAMRHSIS
jgi:hypothetical protein